MIHRAVASPGLVRPTAFWLAAALALAVALRAYSAAPPADVGAVAGTVDLSAAAKSGGEARITAEAVYAKGAMGGAGMAAPAAPPLAVVSATPRDSATRETVEKLTAGISPVERTINQHNMQFEPAVLAVQVGTPVLFPNDDDFFHNVFSYSSAKTFDLGRYRKGEAPAKVVFDKAGVVKIYCEIHEHMRCTIYVLDTPYFVLTDAAGRYRLGDLPPGAYTLTAWFNDKEMWSRTLDVAAGRTAQADLPAAQP